MQSTQLPPAIDADIGQDVLVRLRRMGLEPLPRNYEIVYEALEGSNPVVADALTTIGERPTQDMLDGLADMVLQRRRGREIMQSVHDSIVGKLNEILALLKAEESSLRKFGHVLDATSVGLRQRDALSQEFLQKVAGAMTNATDVAIDSGRRIVSSIGDKSDELSAVKAQLADYKKLSETDPLTRLPNRRCFDEAISKLYRDPREALFGALVLADLDCFKSVNDRFGHPVGDRILQIVAGSLDAAMGTHSIAARTGGEEFGIVVNGLSERAVLELAEEIRLTVERTPFVNDQTGIDYGPITISLGICMAAEATGPDELYRKTDRALYASKNAGRNKVTAHSALQEGGFTKSWRLYSED